MVNMFVINNKINFHTQKRSSWTIKWEQSSTHHCWPALRAFSSLLSSAASFTCLIVISRLSFWLIILPFHYHQGYQCYQWFSLYFPRWYHIPTYLSIWTPAPLVVEAEIFYINGVHPAFAKTCLIKTWHRLVSVTRPFLPYKMINDNIVKASSVSI